MVSGCFLGSCLGESRTRNDEQFGTRVTSVEIYMPEPVRAIFKRSCESCHGVDGRGITGVAPNLKYARHRSTVEWEKYLKTPHSAHPVSQISPVWLDGDEIKTMAEYLSDLTQK
jgi:mono/diheme cytochrome c family protein